MPATLFAVSPRGALLLLCASALFFLWGAPSSAAAPALAPHQRPPPAGGGAPACTSPGAATWHQRRCEEADVWGGCVRLEMRDCPAVESAAALDRCLQNRHVLFLGDSVSRYMFLSLAQFLHQGAWDTAFFPPTEFEGYYSSWTEFFQVTHGRLGGSGRAVCDCYRKDYAHKWVLPAGESGGESVTTVGSLENRFFRSSGGARLSFLQVFGSHPLVWHDPRALGVEAGGSFSQQRLCEPAECSPFNTTDVRVGSLEGPEVRALVAQLAPTDIVVNSGLWESWERDKAGKGPLADKLAAIERMAEAAACARDASLCGAPFSALPPGARPRLWWRTTTAPAPVSLRSFREPRLVAEALRRGWRVMDAGGVGAALRLLISTEGLEVWEDERGSGGWILHDPTPDACNSSSSGGGGGAPPGVEGACPPLLPRLDREEGSHNLPFSVLWADETHPSPMITQGLSKFLAAHLCEA